MSHAPAAEAGAARTIAWGARSLARDLPWRPTALLMTLMLAFGVAVGWIERGHSPLTAPDRTLDLVLSVAVPLGSLALVGVATGDRRLGDHAWWLARYGLSRRYLALGSTLAVMALAALLASLTSVLALAAAYGSVPGYRADALVSAWIAALGAAAYTGWYAFGATLLARGRGRWLVLIVDLLGGSAGWLCAALPRGHLDSLGGGAPLLGLSQPASSVALALMAAVLPILAAYRARD